MIQGKQYSFQAIAPSNIATIQSIKTILHKVYVEDMGWIIGDDNPSGLTVVRQDGCPLTLNDDYESHEQWLAMLDNDEIVAAVRLTGKDDKDLYEMQRYYRSPNLDRCIDELGAKSKTCEMSRLVINPSYEASEVTPFFLSNFLQHLNENNRSIFFACSDWVFPHEQLLLLGFKMLDGESFRYTENDPQEAQVFYLTPINNKT